MTEKANFTVRARYEPEAHSIPCPTYPEALSTARYQMQQFERLAGMSGIPTRVIPAMAQLSQLITGGWLERTDTGETIATVTIEFNTPEAVALLGVAPAAP